MLLYFQEERMRLRAGFFLSALNPKCTQTHSPLRSPAINTSC